jgi:hypothetical protein
LRQKTPIGQADVRLVACIAVSKAYVTRPTEEDRIVETVSGRVDPGLLPRQTLRPSRSRRALRTCPANWTSRTRRSNGTLHTRRAGRTNRTRRSNGTLSARRTGRANRTLRARRAWWTGRALRTSCSCRACRSLWTGRALRTSCSCRACRSLRTRRALWTSRPLRTSRSLRTRRTLRASRSGRSGRSLRASRSLRTRRTLRTSRSRRSRRPLSTRRALWTGRALRTCSSRRAGRSLRTSRSVRTSRPLRTGRSLRTRRTLRASRSLGSCRSLRTGRTSRSRRARGAALFDCVRNVRRRIRAVVSAGKRRPLERHCCRSRHRPRPEHHPHGDRVSRPEDLRRAAVGDEQIAHGRGENFEISRKKNRRVDERGRFDGRDRFRVGLEPDPERVAGLEESLRRRVHVPDRENRGGAAAQRKDVGMDRELGVDAQVRRQHDVHPVGHLCSGRARGKKQTDNRGGCNRPRCALPVGSAMAQAPTQTLAVTDCAAPLERFRLSHVSQLSSAETQGSNSRTTLEERRLRAFTL